jgi:hypothetical protein
MASFLIIPIFQNVLHVCLWLGCESLGRKTDKTDLGAHAVSIELVAFLNKRIAPFQK